MKILELALYAFGPFSDVVLDLSAGQQGLHLIYGPNEAGKSSALRALRQALFGIPAQSADSFIHSYTKMRIGLTLRPMTAARSRSSAAKATGTRCWRWHNAFGGRVGGAISGRDDRGRVQEPVRS